MARQGLAARLAAVLSGPMEYDFRTAESLAKELDADIEDVRWAAQRLIDAGKVRRPIVSDPKYQDWYAPASMPLTRREKLIKWMAMMGREPL